MREMEKQVSSDWKIKSELVGPLRGGMKRSSISKPVRLQQYSDESDALFSLFSEGLFPPELEDVQFFIPIDRRCFQRRNEAPVPRFAC